MRNMMTKERLRALARIASAVVALMGSSGNALAWNAEDYVPGSTAPGMEGGWSAYNGHFWITGKAIDYLAERGLLPPEMDSNDEIRLLMYGSHFADAPWSGLPESPSTPVANYMDVLVPQIEAQKLCRRLICVNNNPAEPCQATPGQIVDGNSVYAPFPCLPAHMSKELTIASDGGALFGGIEVGKVGHASVEWLRSPNWALRFKVVFGGKEYNFAEDNLYHYSYRDLKLLNYGMTDDRYDLRLGPLTIEDTESDKELVPEWVEDGYEYDFLKKLNGVAILQDAEFGAAKYGAVLYQVARKFFALSWAEPSLTELIRASSQTAGWRTGTFFGERPLLEGTTAAPSTFLGGMPYICKPSTPTIDPCKTGEATWPPWVPESGSIEGQLTKAPGRRDKAALIYLGWALHMLQDLANPHHAVNAVGPKHKVVDGHGDANAAFDIEGREACTTEDTIPPTTNCRHVDGELDRFMRQGLDATFGTVANPKSRDAICTAAGLSDGQVVPGSLNYNAPLPLFVSAVKDGNDNFPATYMGGDPSTVRPNMRFSIHTAMKLLLCAPTRTLSPALITVATSIAR